MEDNEITQGTADCLHCGQRADVLIVGETFRLVCATCGWEIWGVTSQADRDWIAAA